jgi:hypothetical protein
VSSFFDRADIWLTPLRNGSRCRPCLLAAAIYSASFATAGPASRIRRSTVTFAAISVMARRRITIALFSVNSRWLRCVALGELSIAFRRPYPLELQLFTAPAMSRALARSVVLMFQPASASRICIARPTLTADRALKP